METLFEEGSAYEEMLNKGIGLSGESKDFFMEGRLANLKQLLPDTFTPQNILDFGCGTGETSQSLAALFPMAKVYGSEIAEGAIAFAKQKNKQSNVSFIHNDELSKFENAFDLVYTNGVFHHIMPDNRPVILKNIYQVTKINGYFGFFENNPYNPGTKLVMSRIPFDRDAITISYIEGKRILKQAGFQIEKQNFLFYFPKMLQFFRPLEKYLINFPLGAQYHLLAKKEKPLFKSN